MTPNNKINAGIFLQKIKKTTLMKIKKIILHDTQQLSSMEMKHIIGAQIINPSSNQLACSGKADGDPCSYKILMSISGSGSGPLTPHYITINGFCSGGNCIATPTPIIP